MKDSELGPDLKNNLSCEVSWSASSKALYAADASNYRQIPLAVVLPKTAEDIVQTLSICRKHNAPILMRGGGTSLAGQTCNTAVVIDTSKYYNKILNLDPEQKTVTVQPGIVLDEVRNEAEKHRLTFGPDPSTHNRCTLGGMIGNNSCGVHSVMAGKTVDNIIELDVVTYDGFRMKVSSTTEQEFLNIVQLGGRQSQIYQDLKKLSESYSKLIRERYPHIPRRVSGYNLDHLLPENDFNVARALVGSEGTLAIVLEAKLRLVHSPPQRLLVVVGFEDIYSAALAIPQILELKPIGLEGMDDYLVRNLILKNIHPDAIKELPEGKGWLLVEFGSDTDEGNKVKANQLKERAQRFEGFKQIKILEDKEEQKKLWLVRQSGLGATAYVPGQQDTWEGWEDSAVPPDKVAPYLRDLKKLYEKFNYTGAFYGHFGDGCIHTRINFDLKTASGIKTYHQFISEAVDLVVSYGGSISGEHGDGQSKAEFLYKMFGPELIVAFNEFKRIWDPSNKLNPNKLVHPFSNIENLRLGTSYAPAEEKTHFKYPQDQGSFARATLRCVGIGLCRRHDSGVMCPSYMVTREEKHSTRGRTHLLFEMLKGDIIKDKWNSKEVLEALDLCLACKGCKGECPTNVDMATYKAEFYAHYYKRHFRPRTAYSMGQIYWFARTAGKFPKITNYLTQTPGISDLVKKIAGVHPQRNMPRFADKNFRKLIEGSDFKPKGNSDKKKRVFLWVDTFNNSFSPDIASAALRVLQGAGYEVLFPDDSLCCGRPLYDFGFLNQAKRHLVHILEKLRLPIREGIPVVFLEPGCASVFRDELINFFPQDLDALRLNKQSFLLSEFLLNEVPDYKWPRIQKNILVQGHCHHQAIMNFQTEKLALMRTGAEFEILDSGCCGMAGSFGFAKEHYLISQAIGERSLFKKINSTDENTLILANGFSCREQIKQATGRTALHLAQILDSGF
ncbi:MAG: FAD-binding and (Fe-S)-binding domain-containing protein [Bdellovibrio sp.]